MNGAALPSTLELALLGLIRQDPSSGYDLCRIFETTPMMHFSASPGAIYPALKRLERRGLIASRVARAETLRPRRVYEVTDAGVEALRRWVSQKATREDVIWRSEELMLRFGFMGLVVDRHASRTFLAELAAAVDAYVVELEGHRKSMLALEPPHGRLALEHGLEGYRSMAAWARRAAGELAGGRGKRRKA